MTTSSVTTAVHLWAWDANDVYGNGLTEPPTAPEKLTDLLEHIGQAMASGGQVVVLPGAEPATALVVCADGTSGGRAVRGSVNLW
jgi:hypothetical protein